MSKNIKYFDNLIENIPNKFIRFKIYDFLNYVN